MTYFWSMKCRQKFQGKFCFSHNKERLAGKLSLPPLVSPSLPAWNTDKMARGLAAIVGSRGNKLEDESHRAENGDAAREQVSQKDSSCTSPELTTPDFM